MRKFAKLKRKRTSDFNYVSLNSPEQQFQAERSSMIAEQGRQRIFSHLNERFEQEITTTRDEPLEAYNARETVRARNKALPKGREAAKLPNMRQFPPTPVIDVSNVGREEDINAWQGTYHIQEAHPGETVQIAIQADLEWTCDYANRWHSSLGGVNRHGSSDEPLFYCFPPNFRYELREDDSEKSEAFSSNHVTPYLTQEQFWRLRYLFIPIIFTWVKKHNGVEQGHVALLIISPQAKTIDYLCSNDDSGLAHERKGSKCLEQVFKWLAYWLRQDEKQYQLVPSEWRMRTNAGENQGYAEFRKRECGLFSTTHAMSLAFRYSSKFIKWENNPAIKGHMRNRGMRLSHDLYLASFAMYAPNPDEQQAQQYYPLLDTAPDDGKNDWDGWTGLVSSVTDELPLHIRHIKANYVLCEEKDDLKEHCRRNRRFYPGWADQDVSGDPVSFDDFLGVGAGDGFGEIASEVWVVAVL
jgi:hypothetical protein